MQDQCKLLPLGEYELTIPAREGEDLTDTDTLLSVVKQIQIRQEIKLKCPIKDSLLISDLTKKTILLDIVESMVDTIPTITESILKHKGEDSLEEFNETEAIFNSSIDRTIKLTYKLDKGFYSNITDELVNIKFNLLECYSDTSIKLIDNYLFSKHN